MLAVISFRNLFWLGLMCCLIFSFFSLKTLAQEVPLTPAKKITIKNGKNTSYTYTINAQKDQVISLEIKQNGMDIATKLFDSKNVVIATSDYPFSEQDTEIIFVIAKEDGKFLVEITSKFPGDKGFINIKLDKIRAAAPNDLKHAEAEKLFSEAQNLRKTASKRQSAVEVFEKSLLLWRESGNQIGELRTLTNLAYLYRLVGNYKKSNEISAQILQFPDLEEFKSYKFDAFYQIGQIQFLMGKIEEAIKTQKQALEFFPQPHPKQANTYGALANYYQRIAEFEFAQTALEKALNNIKQFPDMYNEAQTRHIQGLLFITLKDFDSAITNLKVAANLREKFGNQRGQAGSLSLIGSCYYYKKDFSTSFEFLNKALAISQDVGDVENQADTLAYLAVNYRESGNPNKAVELLNQALSLFTDKNAPVLSSTYITLGVTHTELGNFAQARESFEKALMSYRKIGDLDGIIRATYQFSKLERAENNLDAAKAKIEQAIANHEYLQAKYNNVRYLTNILEIRKGYFDTYIDILMRLEKDRPNENFAFKAFQVSENAKMRTLIWQLREAFKNSPQSVEFQLITKMQKVQQQIGEQLSLLAKAQSNPNQSAKIDEIEKTIGELNKEDESLKAQLRLKNPNVANLSQPPLLSLETLQKNLDDETVLVEYSLGEKNSYLWIVSKSNFRAFTLPKRAEIDAQAKSFYETLVESVEGKNNRLTDKKQETKKAKGKNVQEEADKLSRILLVDKLAELSAKRLVFVTDGALNLVPFASLTISGATSKYLSDKFELVQEALFSHLRNYFYFQIFERQV